MESLNKIEIRGIVGQVNFTTVGDKKHANFSVMTETAARSSQDGSAVVDTTWFNVSAWEGPKNGIDNLEKGSVVYLLGRIRIRCVETANGSEKILPEVVANEVRVERKKSKEG